MKFGAKEVMVIVALIFGIVIAGCSLSPGTNHTMDRHLGAILNARMAKETARVPTAGLPTEAGGEPRPGITSWSPGLLLFTK